VNYGDLRNLVTVENPGAAVPDGDGGFTLTYTAADPGTWWASIEKATQRASEARFSGTVIAHASYILSGRFHPGIGAQTRLSWTDRAGARHHTNVMDVDDVEGRGVETTVLVSEVTT